MTVYGLMQSRYLQPDTELNDPAKTSYWNETITPGGFVSGEL